MQTQRDHVEAYSFLIGRMTSALVAGETSLQEPPARRTTIGMWIGVLLAVLLVAGFAIYHLIDKDTQRRAASRAAGPDTTVSAVASAPAALAPAAFEPPGRRARW